MKPNTAGTLVALMLTMTCRTHADVEATLLRVEEARGITFVKDNFGRPPNQLTVQLVLRGAEAEAATAYGDVHFDEAVDDQGRNLAPREDRRGQYFAFQNVFFRTNAVQQHEKPDAPWAYLNLLPAERSAKRIARLRGTFNLVKYEALQSIEASGLKSAGRVWLQAPVAVKMRISLHVVPETPRLVKVTVTGDHDRNLLSTIEVVGPNGEKIDSTLVLPSQDGESLNGTLEISLPLDDSMHIIAKVFEKRTATSVSFDFKDIALP